MTVPTSTAKSGPYAGAGTTGPFTVGFRFLEDAHLQVIRTSSTGVDTTLTLTTDYTVTGAGGASGSVTLVTALAVGQQLTVIRNTPFTQDADYVQNDAFPAESHERALDKLTMQTQQLLEAVDRAAKLPVTSTADSEELVADITLLADNIANLTAIYGAIPAITTVADDLNEPVSEINTVATSIANVNTVGANISDVSTVAGVSSNVTTVAGVAGNVTTVAGIAPAVSTVAGISAAVSAVNSNASNINTVAGNNANVSTVAGVSSAVSTVASISSAVSTVSGINAAVSTVGANNANVSTVAGISANVTTVAGVSTAVSTVSTNIASVNSAAANMAAIIDAPNQAASAANSAAAAAASVASGMYSAVQDKSANYTVLAGDAGDLIRVTTTGGARTITLPAISSVSDGFKVAIVKWTGDANVVTVARSGSDTINGGTSYALGSQYNSATFVADFETAQWFAVASGIGTTNVVVDRFNGTGAQVAFTLSGDPGTANNTYVFVGGVYQQKNTYTLSGTTLTFSAAPPSATGNIEVIWTQPLAVGVPSDGTITPAKIAGTGAFSFPDISYSGTLTGGTGVLNLGSGQFVKDASGNVGIGTAVVRAPLDFGSAKGVNSIPGQPTLSVYNDGTNAYGIAGGSLGLHISANAPNTDGQIRFFGGQNNSAPKENMRIAGDGQQSSVVPGGSTLYPEFKCRAWVNFNGNGTVAIRASGNVSSITDNGTGDYTVNLANAMPDANYTAVTGGGIDSYGTNFSNVRQGPSSNNISSSACRIGCGFDNGALTDWQYVAVAIFR